MSVGVGRLVDWQVLVAEGGSSVMISERKRGKGRKEVEVVIIRVDKRRDWEVMRSVACHRKDILLFMLPKCQSMVSGNSFCLSFYLLSYHRNQHANRKPCDNVFKIMK